MEQRIYKFIQELMSNNINNSSLNKHDFDDLIKTFNMNCEYNIREIGGENMIVETWYSKSNPFLVLNRIYDIDNDNLSKIEPKQRIELLSTILEKEVEIENYEQAAKIRDIIKDITDGYR